jgi:hypothetical protein
MAGAVTARKGRSRYWPVARCQATLQRSPDCSCLRVAELSSIFDLLHTMFLERWILQNGKALSTK